MYYLQSPLPQRTRWQSSSSNSSRSLHFLSAIQAKITLTIPTYEAHTDFAATTTTTIRKAVSLLPPPYERAGFRP